MIKECVVTELEEINEILKNFNLNSISLEQFNNHPFSKYALIKDLEVIGLLNYDIIYDRIELNYIYIKEEYRNKHYASKLIDYLIVQAKMHDCNNISLEVRKSNDIAINLYQKYGFKIVAVRKNYYQDEDGYLMVREMK